MTLIQFFSTCYCSVHVYWYVFNILTDSWKSITAKSQKSKVKKPVFRIDFDEEIDFDARFKTSKATSLTRTTLNKYSKDQTTLPKDHHYDADTLFRLFLLKRRMVCIYEPSKRLKFLNNQIITI